MNKVNAHMQRERFNSLGTCSIPSQLEHVFSLVAYESEDPFGTKHTIARSPVKLAGGGFFGTHLQLLTANLWARACACV